MRSVLLSVLSALFVASNVAAQVSRTTHPDVVQDIRHVIRERLDGAGRADAIAWGRFVADDCLCVTSTKAAIQREIAARPSSLKNWYGDIVALEVHVYVGTAGTRYRVTE